MPKVGNLHIENLFQSDIRAMTGECNKVGGINMAQGICDLPTPPEVLKATKNAIDQDLSVYAPAEGLTSLRQAIAGKLEQYNKIKADPETEISVTMGGTGAFAASLMSLFNAGDGLVLFEPFYGYHLNEALLCGLKVDFVPMSPGSFEIKEEALRAAIQPYTKAIVLCTPGNPSGHMLTQKEIDVVAKIAKEKDLVVFSDEIYEYFTYQGREHLSPGAHPDLADRTITVMGLSKTFSITGWRLGYMVAPAEWMQKIRVVHDLLYICAPTPLQHGVVEGFSLPQTYYDELREEFFEKRELFCGALKEAGLEPMVPEGAYYVLSDVSPLGCQNSKEAAMKILEKTGVASVPGRAFFQSPEGEKYVRFCFAVEDEPLKEACRRLKGGF